MAAELGSAVALKLASALGGTEPYIPPRFDPNHEVVRKLIEALGERDARGVVLLLGGGQVEIPLGPFARNRCQRQAILKGLDAGDRHAVIARRAETTERSVRRAKAKGGGDPRQERLL